MMPPHRPARATALTLAPIDLPGGLHLTARRLAVVSAAMAMPLAALLLDLARAEQALVGPGRQQGLAAASAAAALLALFAFGLSLSLLRHVRLGLSPAPRATPPSRQPPSRRPPAPAGAPSPPAVLAPARGRRVLVADDNPVNLRLARAVLDSLGQETVLAENGAEVVALARAGGVDLILMDIHMPVMDGIAATRELRRLGFQAPIVALTASASEQDRALCLAAGMDGFEAKPLGLSAMADILDRLAVPAEAASAQRRT